MLRGTGEDGARFDPTDACKIQPMDNVYSYLMFTLPLEANKFKDKGSLSPRSLVAYVLVFATLFIKGILLFALFKAVVMESLTWQNSIMEPPNIGFTGSLFTGGRVFLAAPPDKCSTGESVCTESNGVFSCAPPSVQLMGRWNDLDIDNDGVWTHDEALEAREILQCKFAVDPVEVFDVFVNFLLAREELIWIHPDIKAGVGIHQAYFTYAAGDLIMCGYRTQKMCANLLQRGVFDAPLRDGSAPRVGKTIASALNYCRELLKEGGICEQNLPSTYAVWKSGTENQCQEPSYEKYIYRHPSDGHAKSMLTVNYEAAETYKMASNDALFSIFRGIVITMFLLAVYAEIMHIIKCFLWVGNYPDAAHFDGEEVTVQEDSTKKPRPTIQATSDHHRNIIGAITALRAIMACIFVFVGVTWLMRGHDWLRLLLSGIVLVFIMEVANKLFSYLVDSQLQEEYLTAEPMYVQLHGWQWFHDHPSARGLVGFGLLCLSVFVVTQVHEHYVGIPLSQAMECACTSSGEHCREAQAFDHHFWDNYWTQDLPDVFTTIKQLKIAEGDARPMGDIKGGESQVTKRRRDKFSEVSDEPPPGFQIPNSQARARGAYDSSRRASEGAYDRSRRASDSARDRASSARDSAWGASNSARDRARNAGDSARDRARGARDSARDSAWGAQDRASDSAWGARDSARDSARRASDSAKRASDSAKDKISNSWWPVWEKIEPRRAENDQDDGERRGPSHGEQRPFAGRKWPKADAEDGTISWAAMTKSGHFEARGRRRRSQKKEQMVNKPGVKPPTDDTIALLAKLTHKEQVAIKAGAKPSTNDAIAHLANATYKDKMHAALMAATK